MAKMALVKNHVPVKSVHSKYAQTSNRLPEDAQRQIQKDQNNPMSSRRPIAESETQEKKYRLPK